MRQAIFDFETQAFDKRPRWPPKPTGVAVQLHGQNPRWYGWDHPTNNGIWEKRGKKYVRIEGDPKKLGTQAIKEAYKHDSILGHNSTKFDVDVAETHLGIKPPEWHKMDDSLFSRFLADPHARTLRLKDSCRDVLGIQPDARDEVYDWLADHGHINKARMDHGVAKYSKNAGFFIAQAPGDLVGRYAIDDLILSKALWTHDIKIIKRDGMLPAYEREKRVAPILLANERAGMRVDVDLLEHDQKLYRRALGKVEDWLRKKLRAPAGINWDSDDEVATALRKSGQVKIFPKTATGKDSVSKNRLTAEFFSDPNVYRAMVYRNTVAYVLTQNIEPWLETATLSGGFVYTEWQQVRSDSEHGGGARSGRVTCSKWANIIKSPTEGKNPDYLKHDDEKIRALIGLPELPLARKYCLPDEGEQWGHVDWNQQELRLTAHYEEAELAAKYREDKSADIHQYTTDLINGTSGQSYVRGVIKHVNLRQFYGGGAEGLVTHPMLRLDKVHKCRLDCRHKELRCPAYLNAVKIVSDWKKGLPGVVNLTKRLSSIYKRGEPIRTIGGRLYHCKPPMLAKKGSQAGRIITFEYTGLNYLIQPSGADCLKAALIAHDEHPKKRCRLLGTVYDEINISAPKKLIKEQVRLLQEIMETTTPLDVPWKTDGDVRINWKDKVAA